MFTVIISPFCADDSEKYFVHCLKSPPIPIYIYLWRRRIWSGCSMIVMYICNICGPCHEYALVTRGTCHVSCCDIT